MLKRLNSLLFQNQSARQTVVKNIFWLTLSQFVSRFARAFFIVYAARTLGAAEYGIFSYILGLAGFFMFFSDLGLNPVLTREAAKYPQRRLGYFSTIVWLKLSLLVLSALMLLFIAPHFSKFERATALIPIVSFLLLFDGLREFFIAFFRSQEKMEREALLVALTNIAIAVLGFVVLKMRPTAEALTFFYVASVGVGVLAGVAVLHRELLRAVKEFSVAILKSIIRPTLSIALVSVTGVLLLNTDIIMLGWWRSPADVGYYSAGQKVVQLLFTFSGIFASSVFPLTSRLVSTGEEDRLKNLVTKAIAIAFSFILPIIVGGIVLARDIIVFLYGTGYDPAVSVFQIGSIMLLTHFFWGFFANLIFALNKQLRMMAFSILGSLTQVGLGFLLIPRYGIMGAAIAVVLGQAAQLIPSVLIIVRTLIPWRTLFGLVHLIPALLCMALASFLLSRAHVHVLANIALSGGLYLVLLYFFKNPIVREGAFLFSKIKQRGNGNVRTPA